jgi:hypothetical protein
VKNANYDPNWKLRFWRDFFEPLFVDVSLWVLGAFAAIMVLFILLFLRSLFG